MRPMAAAAIGALISGVAFYAVGIRAAQTNQIAEMPALVQTVDGRYVHVPNAQPVGYPQLMVYPPNAYATALPGAYTAALQPPATPVVVQQAPAPTRTVYRTVPTAQPVQERVVERAENGRSAATTALVIGGTAASGAGVGGLIGGKKGALVGAAIGGGAASIYEATRRR